VTDQTLETYVPTPAAQAWLKAEIAKMVAECDCRHLIYTTFDQNLAAGVKNAVIRHIYTEWKL